MDDPSNPANTPDNLSVTQALIVPNWRGGSAKMAPPFSKGQSGNISGRPTGYPAFVRRLRTHTEAAEKAILDVINDEDHPQRLAAAMALITFAWGKPKESVVIDGDATQADPAAAQARMLELVGQLMARKAAKDEAELPQYGPELPAGKEPGRMGGLSTEWDAVSSAPEPRQDSESK